LSELEVHMEANGKLMNKITEALNKRFQDHRVIFWYDTKEELRPQYEELEISDVKKVHVQGNEFEVKHLINIQAPETKFLLYFSGEKPVNQENWLLDMELAHHVFHTDQEAMFLQELGLGYHLKELVAEHIDFYKSTERRTRLKELLGSDDEHQAIRYKMLAVLFETENVSLVTFIHAHGSGFAEKNENYDNKLEQYNLKDYYWGEIARKYNYQNDSPGIYDFLLEAFSNNFALGKKTGLAKESRLLLSLWKDTILFRDSFAKISDKVAEDLNVDTKLEKAIIEEIVGDELFRLSDYRIIHELVNLITSGEIGQEKVTQYIKQRENKYWYGNVEDLYQSLEFGAEIIAMVSQYATTSYNSFNEGVEHYASVTFEIDQAYRKFIWYYRKSGQNKILAQLAEKIEKVYSNDWLLSYSNKWQSVIDHLSIWPNEFRTSQQKFFNTYVKPYLDKGQRLFVIISDAFRYECGVELSRRLQSENRYESSIQHLVSCLPSYTQLGMASLLPHKELSIQEKSDTILVDGVSSSGLQARAKILAANSGARATAVNAEDFMKMNSATEGRDFVKQYDLIYIYHNRIDKTGDDKTSEERVFEAVEDELLFLMDLMKKIANMNGNNMIITSDHGFQYQHNTLDESDFSKSNHSGEIWKENRRFVIGTDLVGDNSTHAFRGPQLNISSDVDILIPKSINRLRIKGAGTRFIHGGASLQEIVIPMIKVSRKRQDTVSKVDIDIIKSTDRITTNILAVSFIQSNLVTEQVLPRSIRAGLHAEDGELLSDQLKYLFDINEGSERQREVKHRFQLSSKASGRYKNQRIKLVLDEPLEGTTKWKHYKDYYYTLNISFTNDFDDF
jgi:uncharacterized protein (TIGR02687 family)